jgi:tetratricopeptide (TPR) repeat protein
MPGKSSSRPTSAQLRTGPMDLLDFDGEQMYFDQPLNPDVDELIKTAAELYGEPEAERNLLRAYFLEPGHLAVLVALYRYFYYRHCYADALVVAGRAIELAGAELGLSADWRVLSRDDFQAAAGVSMTMTRFLLLTLKGAGYLKLRLGDARGALELFEKVAEMDTSDRLDMSELLALARAKLVRDRVAAVGGNVTFLSG